MTHACRPIIQKQLQGLHRYCHLQLRRLFFPRPHSGTHLLPHHRAILPHLPWPRTPQQVRPLLSRALTSIIVILQACKPLAPPSRGTAIESHAGTCHLALLKGIGTANRTGNSLNSTLQGKACKAGTPARSSLLSTCRLSHCSQQIMQVNLEAVSSDAKVFFIQLLCRCQHKYTPSKQPASCIEIKPTCASGCCSHVSGKLPPFLPDCTLPLVVTFMMVLQFV